MRANSFYRYAGWLAYINGAANIIGVWLIMTGLLALAGSRLPRRLAWLSIGAGIALILIIMGFWIGGQEHPLTTIGGLGAFLGILAWSLWLGRHLLKGQLPGQNAHGNTPAAGHSG